LFCMVRTSRATYQERWKPKVSQTGVGARRKGSVSERAVRPAASETLNPLLGTN